MQIAGFRRLGLIALLCAVLVVGCSAIATDAIHMPLLAGTSVGRPQQATPPAFHPVADRACAELRDAMSQTLGTSIEMAESPFVDYVGGLSGTGCQLMASGTGETFPDFIEVSRQLGAMLGEHGWTEDTAYIADGPTGTATAFRKRAALGLLTVGWSPAPQAGCPTDQPVTSCQLAPAQQLYTIVLLLAQA